MAGLAASGIAGGLAAVGNRPLVGLDGHLLAPGQAAGAVLLAWVCVLAPTLAFAAVGLLGSVALGRSPMGLLLPALLALALQLAQLLPLPVAVRLALPSYAFLAWRGLFTDPAQTGPLLVGIAVSLAWAVVATALAYLLFLRRDFTDLGVRRVGPPRPRRGGAAAGGAGRGHRRGRRRSRRRPRGSGIDKAKLERSLATAFAHLYRLQTGELHRPDVTEAQLRASAACDKGGSRVADEGPGNDWRCVVSWHLPGADRGRLGHLPARRHRRRAVRRRRRRTEGGQRLLPGAHPDGDAPEPPVAVRRQRRPARPATSKG